MEKSQISKTLHRIAAEMPATLEPALHVGLESNVQAGAGAAVIDLSQNFRPPSLSDVLESDLLAKYNFYFWTEAAATPAQVETSLALRYQVYCLERKFEDAEQHVDRLERDEFDDRALHNLIFHRPTAEAIGTVRLILSQSRVDGLPIQELLRENGLDAADYFPLATTAEVSRFAISNKFRRRACDNDPPASPPTRQAGAGSERRGNLPCLGLIQILLQESLAHGITHWAAVMEPKLLRMLASMGIHFTSVGPTVSHHGIRQPSYCNIREMLDTMCCEQPEFWRVVTNAGEAGQKPKSNVA